MEKKTGFKIVMILLIAGIIAVAGIFAYVLLFYPGPYGDDENGLIRVTDEDGLKKYLEEYSQDYSYSRYEYPDRVFFADDVMAEESLSSGRMDSGDSMIKYAVQDTVPPAVAQSLPGTVAGGSGASVYSETNVQVRGVDEADYLKNDGKYIYILKDSLLTIVDAYPAEKSGILSETKIPGYRTADLFLKGDRLVVFADGYEEEWITPEGSSVPVPVTEDAAKAYIFDISDRSAPEILHEITMPGSYSDARMTDGWIYAVTKKPVNRYDSKMPVVKVDSTAVSRPEIWCPPVPYSSFVMYTITSFDTSGSEVADTESFLLGWDDTMYVSAKNIYLSYIKNTPYYRGMLADGETGSNGPESVIHRFSIGKGDIEYKSTGTVAGRLLNQWSLDEYNDNLRVAATVNNYGGGEISMYNSVYVLNPELEIRGRLEYIAPDERIYSARFAGDRLYLVTFKEMDPFFVIDLSNPDKPGILGELKIPGYSDYLHPYDEDHIIGIGKSAEKNEWGGVSATGLKVALFDVTDVNSPALTDSVEIGDYGSDSEALRDHKALLFDKEKNILVLPVWEIADVPIDESMYGNYEKSYTREIFNGAYVFGISPESGFILKGKVKQGDSEINSYYRSGPEVVRRSLYMDDVLYTVSDELIVMSSLKDLSIKINEVMLRDNTEYTKPHYNIVR
ncbi:beta-propeller domain-containing protein [Methanoplanus limicola]|uniref:Beta propeller domain-containing protein n=1 Tax=Methanoplanus limicola DSM 2279 TaxID=937775 RepID=H1YXF3_9EURY|nr:beta-propeller domain-containing protein [Methanoplanus limicola]EHQ36890.1 Beta propeller domain-containing protein [Methanoplanus limicola DSM 2279]